MSESDLKPIRFITGMHRSGTTWVGKMAEQAAPGCVVHEPLNAHSGLVGVKEWYYGPAESSYALSLIAEMMRGKRTFRRSRSRDTALKNLARIAGGSRYERNLSHTLRSSDVVLLKDPFLIRLGADMAERFDAKGIIMVRHPAALINSLRRMGWILPKRDGFAAETKSEDPELQLAYEIGFFWEKLYSEVEAQIRRAPEKLLLVRHEDMCTTPTEIGEKILAHLDLPQNDEALDFLRVSTSGEAGEISGKQLHNMHRDAKKLAKSWRISLSEAQISMLRTGAGGTLRNLYPE
ncbi:sulfotransferase family protein [Salipiger profundus]|uniref:sulfotransferase family protein n=1 Tax=Salipiger profundus TaxID=1229727 RepID=UPI0008E4A8A7|nr:sulfotransferase [Salipiger profundus]SFD73870.1 Sulfotransferase family protein [Salipiger profundus]